MNSLNINTLILRVSSREVRIFNNNITRSTIINIIAFNLPFIAFFNRNLFYTCALLGRTVISNPTGINNYYNNVAVYIILGIRGLINIKIIRRTGALGLSIRVVRSRDY